MRLTLGVISMSSSAAQYEIVSSSVIFLAGATKFLSSAAADRKLLRNTEQGQREGRKEGEAAGTWTHVNALVLQRLMLRSSGLEDSPTTRPV